MSGGFYEVPASERHRLAFGAPYRFELLEIPAGPRHLPSWAWDAQINWRWEFSNRPDYLLRCRHDPLAFTKSPVWRMFEYEDDRYDAGARRMGRQPKGRGWIAESEGVATCHYHSGMIRMAQFEDAVTDENGRVVWLEEPDYAEAKQGVPQTRTYSMLATDKQEGYAGRHFDIALAEQVLPLWDGQRTVPTKIEAGTKLRLRGPWHGVAPAGYQEVSYQYDREPYTVPGRRSWHRQWYRRLGYFGLCIDPAILIDIMATFQPHVQWARVTFEKQGGDRVGIEPLHPETGLPKGWMLDPEECDHEFMLSNYSTNRRPQPSDECRWCRARRDPTWFPADHRGEPMAWWTKGKDGLTFPRYPRLSPASPADAELVGIAS